MNSRVAGPDFICLGMPKAGTGWLFDQLRYHPDFWMPPVKGLHYLDRELPAMKNCIKRLQKVERGSRTRNLFRRAGDERDLAFLREAVALSGVPRDVARYSALFRYKGDLLSGDITAPCAGLEANVIGEIGSLLPGLKVILLITEPVKRYLVGLFTDELRECTRLFGGQTREWAAQYGL